MVGFGISFEYSHPLFFLICCKETRVLGENTMIMKRPRVTFSTVEVIELPYCLGDNPSVNGGPPLSTGWESQQRSSMTVNGFENNRPPRRNKRPLQLNKSVRAKVLLHSGHTESEIEAATIEATKTRRGRHDTVKEIKQKYKALLEAGSLGEAKRLYQQRQPLSPVPSSQSTTRRRITTGLTPSPIIPRKNSPLRITAPHLSPTTSQLRHLQFPSSPDGGVFSPRFNVLPRRKRAAPIDLGDDLFASSCSSSAFSSNHARSSPKRVCSPKQEGSGSPRSLFVSSSSVVRVPSSPRRRPLSPFVDKRPLMQPRRVPSPPPPMLYQQRTPPRAM